MRLDTSFVTSERPHKKNKFLHESNLSKFATNPNPNFAPSSEDKTYHEKNTTCLEQRNFSQR